MSIAIPFYNEALFSIYFYEYKSETLSEDIGEDYFCDYYLLNMNDLMEELLEKIRALGYTLNFSLDTPSEEIRECYGLDVEPNDPGLHFHNTINVLLDGNVRVKIIGHKDQYGSRFIMTTTLENPRKQEIIDLLKQTARVSTADIEKRAHNYNRRRVLLPQLAVRKGIPTGPVGIINSFLGPKGHADRNISYIFESAKPKQNPSARRQSLRQRKGKNYTRKRGF